METTEVSSREACLIVVRVTGPEGMESYLLPAYEYNWLVSELSERQIIIAGEQ